ncbi:MAG: hypothetical protein DI624_14905 [Brevundimonas sp.]|nr:MAG: hypothetical protein DI624_14905 [Brevundimonas sp.]
MKVSSPPGPAAPSALRGAPCTWAPGYRTAKAGAPPSGAGVGVGVGVGAAAGAGPVSTPAAGGPAASVPAGGAGALARSQPARPNRTTAETTAKRSVIEEASLDRRV